MKKKGTAKWIFLAIVLIAVLWIVWSITTKPEYPYIDSPQPFLGNPDASIVIIEYADLQCPSCAYYHPIISSAIDKYNASVRYEMKHFPLTAIHSFAYNAARGAECANDQGMAKFWEFVDQAYANQDGGLNNKGLKRIASSIGLDREKFDACLDSGAKKEFVNEDMASGNQAGIKGTPSLFINGRQIDIKQFSNIETILQNEISLLKE